MFQMEFFCPASTCENIFPTFGAAIEHRVVKHPNKNIKKLSEENFRRDWRFPIRIFIL